MSNPLIQTFLNSFPVLSSVLAVNYISCLLPNKTVEKFSKFKLCKIKNSYYTYTLFDTNCLHDCAKHMKIDV